MIDLSDETLTEPSSVVLFLNWFNIIILMYFHFEWSIKLLCIAESFILAKTLNYIIYFTFDRMPHK